MAGCWISRRRRSNGTWRPRPTRRWPACRSRASPSTRTRPRGLRPAGDARRRRPPAGVLDGGRGSPGRPPRGGRPRSADVAARSRRSWTPSSRRTSNGSACRTGCGGSAGERCCASRRGTSRRRRSRRSWPRSPRSRRRASRAATDAVAREGLAVVALGKLGGARAELRLGRRRRVRPRGERARTAGGGRARERGPGPRARRPDGRGDRAPRRHHAPPGRRSRRAVVVARRDARVLRDAGRRPGNGRR